MQFEYWGILLIPRMMFRTVESMMEKSAMFAASVKSSARLGVLMKAICAAPIYDRVSAHEVKWGANIRGKETSASLWKVLRYGIRTYEGNDVDQRAQ
jgi:hypothetical protein